MAFSLSLFIEGIIKPETGISSHTVNIVKLINSTPVVYDLSKFDSSFFAVNIKFTPLDEVFDI